MRPKHILSVDDFDIKFIEQIFLLTNLFTSKIYFEKPLEGKIVANLFYRPSTRTSSSFFSAATKLGANVLQINEVRYSSIAKGECLEDTIRTLGCYSDLIVLRHYKEGSAKIAAEVSYVPIINAGDGKGEHPTQALLDLYTIYSEQGTVNSLNIGLMGDLKYSRTVHSLVKLLRMFRVNIFLISPENLMLPKELVFEKDIITDNLSEVLKYLDVLYVTRLQQERHEEEIEYPSNFIIRKSILDNCKENLSIMHPLPRLNEIEKNVDFTKHAAYFKQVKNGMFVRMALLKYMLIR